MNELQIFNNEQFGSIRGMEIDGEPWFIGKDVAKTLGYEDTDQALRKHIDEEDRLTRQIDGSGQKRNMTIINESGLYSLIFSSKLPAAKDFKRWVTSEVLPTIRKTGSYTMHTEPARTPDSQARLLEAQAKQAEIMLAIADRVTIDSYKQIVYSKAMQAMTGEYCLPLPKLERDTYTATEIGERLGISSNMVGKLANKHNLKTSEYGVQIWDVAPNGKQIPNWRYYIEVLEPLSQCLELEEKLKDEKKKARKAC